MVAKEGSVGQCLYVGAALGGAQALGRKSGQIAVGNVVLNRVADERFPNSVKEVVFALL